MTAARLAGRVTGVPQAPGFFLIAGTGFAAGQGACGRAVICSQAVMIASAQGQVAAILRRLRRLLVVRRGGVQEAVAQGLGLGFGEGPGQGEQPQPGQQGGGGQPGLVEREGTASTAIPLRPHMKRLVKSLQDR
jgi:hypothetical protein